MEQHDPAEEAAPGFDPAAALVARADALITLSRPGQAVPLLHRAIEAAPHDPDPRISLALAHLVAGDGRASLAAAEQAVAADPASARGHAFRAFALLSLRRRHPALKAASEAMGLDPQDALVAAAYVLALIENRRRKEAQEVAALVVRELPDESFAHNLLGRAMLARRNWKEAEACFWKALALDPASADDLSLLGAALAGQRKWLSATGALYEAVRLDPADEDRKRAFLLTVLIYAALLPVACWAAMELFPILVLLASETALPSRPLEYWVPFKRGFRHGALETQITWSVVGLAFAAWRWRQLSAEVRSAALRLCPLWAAVPIGIVLPRGLTVAYGLAIALGWPLLASRVGPQAAFFYGPWLVMYALITLRTTLGITQALHRAWRGRR